MSIKHLYADERPSLLLDFANSKTLDPRITFTRNSTATYVDEQGVIKTAADNEARFDHNGATGESLGFLLEESRTNLRTYSTAPNSSNDYRIYTTAAYNTTETLAPDGTNTATKITGNGTIYEGFDIYPNTYGQYAGVEQTFSFYVKPVNATSIRVSLVTSHFYDFNFTTETGTLTNGTGGGFEKLANGWYRVWYTGPKSNQFWYHGGYIDSAAATSNSVYIWGVQLENGAFPTSYIPTTSSSVTRSADVASMTGTNFSSWYNQSQGTIQVKYSSPTDTSSAYKRLVSISDSSQNSMSAGTGFLYGSHSPSTSTRWMARNGTSIWYAGLASPASLSSAIAYQDDNLAISYDGATVLTNTNFTVSSMSPLPSRLDFFFNGTISRLAYYNTRLSDTTLEALTK